MTERFRASDILGTNVTNAADETMGSVKDLVISRDNNVLHAILSVGGFLGIGETLVAVPYDKLQIHRVDGRVRVMYNTTKAEVEHMPKFVYNESSVGVLTFRASDLMGANVTNALGDSIGDIEDLIITAADTVPTAVISVGGFLGIGDRSVAVPYTNLKISRIDNQQAVMYNATEEELKALPAFIYN
jgi:ribosomal 30S subunit maturation factor RimM